MKKGFTLVEIIAVVSLLAILGLIGTISVTTILKNNRNESYNLQINNIKEATKTWGAKRLFILPDEGNTISLKLSYLKQEGLIDKDIKNPKTEKLFSNDTIITITKTNNVFEYNVIDFDVESNTFNLNEPQIILKGESEVLVTGNASSTVSYNDLGAIALTSDGKAITNIIKEITENGTIVTSIPLNQEKDYIITYKVISNGLEKTFTRKVSVKF